MQFELVKIDQKRLQKVVLYAFITVVLLCSLLPFCVESKAVYAIVGISFLVFIIINNFYIGKIYGRKVVLSIIGPLCLSLKSNESVLEFNNIEKWDWGQNPRAGTCTFTIINKGVKYNLVFESDKSFFTFIKYFQEAIKQYNQENDIGIKNLRKEFHNSPISKTILTILYFTNFIFVVLLYFSYPTIIWGVCLGISMFFTVLYAVAYYTGKNLDV